MRLLKNSGSERVVDELRGVGRGARLDIATPRLSLFGFGELADDLGRAAQTRLVVPGRPADDLELLGAAADLPLRNRLQTPWLARRCADWIDRAVDVRASTGAIAQGAFVISAEGKPSRVITGACALTTAGLGLVASPDLSLVQVAETADECTQLAAWFDAMWQQLSATTEAKERLVAQLRALAEHRAPSQIYFLTLYHLFKDLGGELDEAKIVRAATGIRETAVWKKLYKFQRDGVIGAIEKLDRFGGCIIADSVGLGKTFEALAVIKYYELRNDRVLVLVPKRLRDNWTLYKTNDRRNVLAADRLNYDVLNHTDLSRDSGTSGEIDLSHVNWGNYDLVVIDESHNFRNKKTPRAGAETRYDRLMRRIIKEGVKTRVLMLSATPVNNRLADLKNQIAFATEGNDAGMVDHGIPSIEATVRLAQQQFNRWQALPEPERRPAALMDMLGFDYFKLLDLLTIARSRKHIQKYYGVAETGRFPERLRPINVKSDVDVSGAFRSIREINDEIRRLHLAAYAPLRYVLPARKAAYDAKYSTSVKGGASSFRQTDREESLIHLIRVNCLKRMESSVVSFALTLERQLADVEATLVRIASRADDIAEPDFDLDDLDDPTFESLVVGRTVKVLLRDVDLVRWRQDLTEDRDRLATLLGAAREVGVIRDAKLAALREQIVRKCETPLNPGNRKVVVFTAFADTARYLFDEIAPWARAELGLHTALVTGTGSNKTTLPGLRTDLASILSAFSPRSKERPADMAADGDLDLLIATDCISEGQNLQDCDTLVNYDIHWNPVRIIQRFGRIDRLGSINERIQLINFWPNIELEEYIGLEQRVSGRMVLLDVSATGEENVIEHQAGNQMNDLAYRRVQLLRLQEAVIDLEDLSSGVSIADLTLNDFRVDLSGHIAAYPGQLEQAPLGAYAITTSLGPTDIAVPPGIIFCLRAVGDAAMQAAAPGYPLAPHYVVHVGDDGAVLLPFTQAKRVLDRMRRGTAGQDGPDPVATGRFDLSTRGGQDMARAQAMLATSVASILGQHETRAVSSLFTPGPSNLRKTEFVGNTEFEVVAFLVVLPPATESSAP